MQRLLFNKTPIHPYLCDFPVNRDSTAEMLWKLQCHGLALKLVLHCLTLRRPEDASVFLLAVQTMYGAQGCHNAPCTCSVWLQGMP
jgi:hypothetical protein